MRRLSVLRTARVSPLSTPRGSHCCATASPTSPKRRPRPTPEPITNLKSDGCYARRVGAIRGPLEVVLVVEDIERSLAFYRDIVGLELISPAELPVRFLRVGAARDG